MARYVTPEIESVRRDPEPGERTELALVVREGEVGDVKQRVEDHGGHVDREFPSGVLLVTIPETELDSFCRSDSLTSVSGPDRMRTLS